MEQQLESVTKPLRLEEFTEACVQFNQEHPGLLPPIENGLQCPVHIFSAKTSYHHVVPGIVYCSL